jgi:hypothetical protein
MLMVMTFPMVASFTAPAGSAKLDIGTRNPVLTHLDKELINNPIRAARSKAGAGMW